MDSAKNIVTISIKAVLLCIGSILIGYLIAILIGVLSPNTDEFSRSKSFNVNMKTAWNILTDISSYPDWKPNLESIELLGNNPEGKPYWREYYTDGSSKEYIIDYQVKNVSLLIKQVNLKQASSKTRLIDLNTHNNATIIKVTDSIVLKKPFIKYKHRFVGPSLESQLNLFLVSMNEYSKNFSANEF